MPITFKTRGYANITMLGEVAKQMLHMMDCGSAIPGAINAETVPRALENLCRALEKQPVLAELNHAPSDAEVKVDLHTRALPLIELLQTAIDDATYVRWE